MTSPSDIAHVMDALLARIEKDNADAVSRAADSPFVADALSIAHASDLREFQHRALLPIETLLEGILAQAFPHSREARFLFQHGSFVERHFRSEIEKHEGRACCADKTRTIIRQLLNFFQTGKEIAFDYGQEYTFHLPKTIFRTHSEILRFFAAVMELHYGGSEAFVDALRAHADTAAGPATPSHP